MMLLLSLLYLFLLFLNSSSSFVIKKQCNNIINNNNNNNNNNNIIKIKSSSLSSLSASTSSSSTTLSLSLSLSSLLKSLKDDKKLLLLQEKWLMLTNQSKISQDITTLILTVLTGSIVGYIIQLLKNIINILEVYRIKKPLIIPMIGTLLIGYFYTIRSDINIGPSSIYSNDDKSFSFNRQLLRIIAVVIAIGTGNALALAGPAAEVGITIARLLGLSLLSTEESRRLLCLAGSAAGFSANFLTPISGVLFAMEFSNLQLVDASQKKTSSPHKSLITKGLSFSIIASIFSVITARKGLLEPFKHFLSKYSYDNGMISYQQLLLTSLIGISSGLISKLYRSSITKLSSMFIIIPKAFRPLLCGILCGILSLYGLPQSLSKGFLSLDDIISGRLHNVIPLLSFFVVRLFMIVIANATGVLGGVVAPSLFIGASYGVLINLFFNNIGLIQSSNSSNSLLALIAGASFFSAFFKTPLTAAMLVIEFTRSIDIVIPLILGTSLACIFS